MASAVVCLGLGLAMIDSRSGAPRLAISRDMRIATIGIALFILLPVARVIVMVTAYLRQRDYRLSAIALLVLTVILLGFAVGLAGRRGKTADASMQVPEESVPPDDVHAISRMQDSLPVAAVCTCTPSLFQTTIRVEENRI
jgi:high-affinity K+ transport system ATPase subunit B